MLNANHHFQAVSPTEAGVDPAGILAFLDACAEKGRDLHSILLIRGGKAVAEGYFAPYLPGDKQHVFSVSKSWTSTAVGLASDEGRLSVKDKVISFFPEKLPAEVSENLADMEVRDLLRMGTGHDTAALPALIRTADSDWAESFLHWPVEHRPGSKFVYNSGASYMLSAIVQKVTGEDLITYLTPRLFEPLGITGVCWDRSPQGICCGGWGIHVSTEDIAKLGLLYLNGGVFGGKRILSEEWVREATSPQIDNAPSSDSPDWKQGYGYQIWRCQHGCFRFDGAYGQYMVAFPEQDAVLVLTSFVGNMQEVLDDVWAYLLPAFQEAPLPDSPAEKALEQRLQTLSSPIPQGSGRTGAAEFLCGENDFGLESLQVRASKDGGVLTVAVNGTNFQIPFGTDSYRLADITGFPVYPDMIGNRGVGSAAADQPIGTAGCWTDETLTLRIVYRGTHHHMDFHLKTDGDPSFSFAYPCKNFRGEDQKTSISLTPVQIALEK